MMTAYASEQAAIDAVNLGAFAYVMKHCKNDEFKMFVRNALAAAVRRVGEPRAEDRAEAQEEQAADHRPEHPHALGVQDDRQDRHHAGHRADQRRQRHRQGAGRQGHPRPQRPRRRPLRGHQLRGHSRDPAREPALRPHPGQLHRRRPRPRRVLPAGPGRHHLPRRDRRDAPEHSGQAAAHAAGARGRPGGQLASRSRSTCASSRPPTATWSRRSPRATSAPTSSSGST